MFAAKSSSKEIEEVVVDLLPDVRRWVRNAVGANDAEDILQECIIELMNALEAFRGDAQLKTYAHRVVTRAAIARRRKQRRFWSFFFADDDADAAPASTPDPERALQTQRIQSRVHTHLRKLSALQQECLIYVWIEGLSHAEAAALQSVPLETFRSRLKLARVEFERLALRDPLLAQLATESGASRSVRGGARALSLSVDGDPEDSKEARP